MDNILALETGVDIPFKEAQVNIHQPTIKEISLITEENFQLASRFLDFNRVKFLDQSVLDQVKDFSDFELLMVLLSQHSEMKDAVLGLLTLLFPGHQITINKSEILLVNEAGISRINAFNYDIFRDIIVNIFCLKNSNINGEYNPADGMAQRIAKKFEQRKQLLAKQKGKDVNEKISLFSFYISILAVGEQKDKNELSNYTVYQLIDEFDRYQLKVNYDMYTSAMMAGATGMEEVDNWMKNIHS